MAKKHVSNTQTLFPVLVGEIDHGIIQVGKNISISPHLIACCLGQEPDPHLTITSLGCEVQ